MPEVNSTSEPSSRFLDPMLRPLFEVGSNTSLSDSSQVHFRWSGPLCDLALSILTCKHSLSFCWPMLLGAVGREAAMHACFRGKCLDQIKLWPGHIQMNWDKRHVRENKSNRHGETRYHSPMDSPPSASELSQDKLAYLPRTAA